jgi:hypothetical protein
MVSVCRGVCAASCKGPTLPKETDRSVSHERAIILVFGTIGEMPLQRSLEQPAGQSGLVGEHGHAVCGFRHFHHRRFVDPAQPLVLNHLLFIRCDGCTRARGNLPTHVSSSASRRFFTTFADGGLYRKSFSRDIIGGKQRLLKEIVLELIGLFCQTMKVCDCFSPLGS